MPGIFFFYFFSFTKFISVFRKFFQARYQSVKRFGSRKGLTSLIQHSVCKRSRVCDSSMCALVNPFMSNVFSHPYQLDESIFNCRILGGIFLFLKFKRHFCKQKGKNPIRLRVLRRLFWFCRSPTKRKLELYVSIKPVKLILSYIV